MVQHGLPMRGSAAIVISMPCLDGKFWVGLGQRCAPEHKVPAGHLQYVTRGEVELTVKRREDVG